MATIQGVYLALFGRPADPTGLAFFNAATNNGANLNAIGNLSTQAEYTARFTGMNNIQIINSIYQSLFGRDADVTGLTFFSNALASGRLTINTIAINILDGATGSDLTTVNNKIAAANLYTAALDTGPEIVAYSGTAAADAGRNFIAGVTTTVPTQAAVDTAVAAMVSSVGTNPGSTYSLATTVDNLTGTANNDTFNAYISTASAAGTGSTLTASDSINGGSGTDSLFITVDGDGTGNNTLPAATITNVENFFIRNVATTAGTQTYDFAAVQGEKQVWNNVSTRAVTLNNLGTGTTVGVKGDNSTTVAATTFTMATATDAVSIAIDGGVKGAQNISRAQTGEATVSIASTGAANTVGVIDLDNAGANIKSVTIDATTNLTAQLAAGDFAASSTLTINGAGVVDLSGATLAANITTVNGAGSTGGINVVSGGVNTKITGGTGNDTVAVNALVYNGTATVDGGAGTDTLVFTDEAALTSATMTKLTNFEILRINDDADGNADTFDASLVTGNTGLVIGAISAGNAVTVNKLSAAAAGNVTFAGNQVAGSTINVNGATTVGQLDTLSIKIDDGLTAKNTLTIANLTAAGVETVNFANTDNLTLSSATGLTSVTKIAITGAGDTNITTQNLALNVNSTIDASASTGSFTLNAAAATTNGLAIIGSATKANVITATGQADSIVGGSANDTITGGNGIDTINISQGGEDTIKLDGVILAEHRDTVTGFTVGTAAGFDKVSLLNTDTTATTGAGAAIVIQDVAAAPTSGIAFVTGTNDVLELSFQLTGNGTANDLDNHTDGTGLLASLGQTITVGANTNKGFVIAYQENKAYLYHVEDRADGAGTEANGDTTLQAAEIKLVGVFNDVAAGGFVAGNFILT